MYINKSDDIVNKYNNIYLRSIKLKPIDVNQSGCIDFDVENNDGDPKLKVDIMWEYPNIRTCFLKAIHQIDLKKILLLEKLKILYRGHIYKWS